MQFKNLLVASAAIAVCHAANFTNNAFVVTAGQSFTLTWDNLEGTATIGLSYGANIFDLTPGPVLATGLTGDSYTFTPSADLAAGVAYAFTITDGTGINYSPQFQVSQATGTLSAASSTGTVSASTTDSTAATSSTGTVTGTSSDGTTTLTTTSSTTGTSSAATKTSSGSTTGSSSTGSKTSATSTSAKTTTAPAGSTTTTAPNSSAAGLSSPLAFVFFAFLAIALH